MMAITAEITMKTAIRIRITLSCCPSFISFFMAGLMKSSVSVEEEVSTREESVDMEADRTRITTSAIRMAGRLDSIVGMMESNPPLARSILSENRRPKPPRK